MRFSELEGRRVGVWGWGKETESFAGHLEGKLRDSRIAAVVLEDRAGQPDIPKGAVVMPLEPGGEPDRILDAFSGCDAVVRSPGVSIHRPEMVALRRIGVPVVTPTGLWLHERGGRNVLGITGTKGKSTTATLTARLIEAAGREVRLAGNIGRPALDLLDEPDDVQAVIELSSYQIADLPVGPQTALALNLFPEHLDWHGDMDTYTRDKLRLLDLEGVEACVVNASSGPVSGAPTRPGKAVFRFGQAEGWHPADGGIACGEQPVIGRSEMPESLPGEHNALNLCAALTALEALGIDRPALPEALEAYAPLPHRLQLVSDTDGVLWVDDSISTTAESAIAAVNSYPDRHVILIGGGFERGQDYSELAGVITKRGAAVIGLPDTGRRLVSDAREAGVPSDRAVTARDLQEAVEVARRMAGPGSAVLLSPGAASYNSYTDYAERGRVFGELVQRRATGGRSAG